MYNVNMTDLICNHFAGEITMVFYGSTIPWKGIGKEFWWGWRD